MYRRDYNERREEYRVKPLQKWGASPASSLGKLRCAFPVRLDEKWRHAMLEPGDERERAKAVQR